MVPRESSPTSLWLGGYNGLNVGLQLQILFWNISDTGRYSEQTFGSHLRRLVMYFISKQKKTVAVSDIEWYVGFYAVNSCNC